MNLAAWLAAHSNSISAVANVIMVLVWTVYLQLIYRQYRYQRRPRILINLAKSGEIRVTNMGQESIYLQCVQSVLRHNGGETLTDLTDRVQENRLNARQGTLKAGEAWEIGSVHVLLEEVSPRLLAPEKVRELEVRAVALYGSDESPVGASRCFQIARDGEEYVLSANQVDTRDHSSRSGRAEVQNWLRYSLEETAIAVPASVLERFLNPEKTTHESDPVSRAERA